MIAWVSRQGSVVLQATCDCTVKTVQKASLGQWQQQQERGRWQGSGLEALMDGLWEECKADEVD
jgi:hypothetical protein